MTANIWTGLSQTLFLRDQESLEGIDAKEMESLLEVKIQKAITLKSIKKILEEGKKLNVKFWTDPTWPELHLWHIVPLRILNLFRRAWHNIDLIFWDFTAKIWDPTWRDEGRKALTDEEIRKNMSTFQEQVDPYCNTRWENIRIHQNSSWLNKVQLPEIFDYLSATSLTDAMQRNDFRNRVDNQQSVALSEVIYWTLMWVDSVFLNTDVEIWWIDQLLNFQQVRRIQEFKWQNPEKIIMTPIIQWTDWSERKMSKSYGNYIPALADSKEIYGKIMSIPDNLILQYFKSFAQIYKTDIGSLEKMIADNPLEAKKQLAMYITALSAGNYDIWLAERENFESLFSKGNISIEDTKELKNLQGLSLLDILFNSGDFKSKSEIKRMGVTI